MSDFDPNAFVADLIVSDVQALTVLLGNAAPYQYESDAVAVYTGQSSYVLAEAVAWLRAFRRGESVTNGWDVWHSLTDTREKLDWVLFTACLSAQLRDDDDYLIAEAIRAGYAWERWNNPKPRTDIDAIMRDFLGGAA